MSEEEKQEDVAPVEDKSPKPEKVEKAEKVGKPDLQNSSAESNDGKEPNVEKAEKKEETAADLLGANIEQVKIRKAKGSKNITSWYLLCRLPHLTTQKFHSQT
jgi:hypothetical protein